MQNNKRGKKSNSFFRKYQIRIRTQDFKEVGSYNVSKLDVYALLGIVVLLSITATIFVISYTSFADFIPGLASPQTKEVLIKNSLELEKLKISLHEKEKFANNLRLVLQGKDPIIFRQSLDSAKLSKINIRRTKSDSLLRSNVEMNENYNLIDSTVSNKDLDFLYLYTPLKGELVGKFNPDNKEFWITIRYFDKQRLFAPFDGVVISSKELPDGNFVIKIKNEQGLVARFSNVPKILKDDNQRIYAGETIGLLIPTFQDNHDLIYFSLWDNNGSIDPLKHIDF